MILRLQRRIDGRQQRLHHVIEQVAKSYREQHREAGVMGGFADSGVSHGGRNRNDWAAFDQSFPRNAAMQPGPDYALHCAATGSGPFVLLPYRAAAAGLWALRKLRTRLIVRALSSGGSFHG